MRNGSEYIIVASVMMLTLAGVSMDYSIESNKRQPTLMKETAPFTTQQEQLSEFFKNHGSPSPREMAQAVSQTKRPALMAAIAVKESNGNPKAVGDTGRAKGAFQVWAKYHGEVPDNAADQALQAERILEELLEASKARGHLQQRTALARYNGGDRPPAQSYRYAEHVMRKERELKCLIPEL